MGNRGDSSQLVRGHITKVVSRATVPFMFNPTTVSIAHGWDWTTQAIPGRSHKFVGPGAGGDETISLNLYLDGDRGRLEQRRSGVSVELSVEDVIDQFRAFVLPYDADGGRAYDTPENVVISWGRTIPDIEAVVINVAVTKILFTPQGHCFRAQIGLSILVVKGLNETSHALLGQYDDITFDEPTDNRGSFASLPGGLRDLSALT